jgi:UTP:GlnB (protein PII) uridylyltransferase
MERDTLLVHLPAWLARVLIAVRLARVSTIGKRAADAPKRRRKKLPLLDAAKTE